jgi:hypothetical protein
MTPEPISTAYFINTFHQSVYPWVLLQSKGSVKKKKRYRGKEYTRNNRIAGRVVFYRVPCRIKGKQAISSSQNFLF